jgi:holo-[acyl-carrier protein] synthase
MILPVSSVDRSEHQSARPQGLILDKVYDTESSDDTRVDVSGLDGQLCEISISHDGDFATAVAIVPNVETASDP